MRLLLRPSTRAYRGGLLDFAFGSPCLVVCREILRALSYGYRRCASSASALLCYHDNLNELIETICLGAVLHVRQGWAMKHRAIDNLKTVVPGRRPFILCFAIGTWLASFPPARGEDSDRLRYYFNFRAQDTNVLTDVHDAWGGALGLNLNRYVGVELAVDNYELFLEPGGYGGTIGELSIWSVMPQVRLRYPLLRDRLVPRRRRWSRVHPV